MEDNQQAEKWLLQIARLLLIGSLIGTVVILIVVLVQGELTWEALFFVGIWLVWVVFMLTRSDMLKPRRE